MAGRVGDPEESKANTLNKIDTAFWNTSDKDWMAQRRADWPKIEEMLLSVVQVKKHLPLIKSYYLRGEIPDWDKGQAKYDPKPHLNLFLFLWLHPSWDEAVLTEVRESYINSQTIWHRDVEAGYSSFLVSQGRGKTLNYADVDGYEIYPDLNGFGELLFRVMYINPVVRELNFNSYRTENLDGTSGKVISSAFRIPDQKFDEMVWMSQWLRLGTLVPYNYGFMYQYDDVLNYWYQNVKDKNYFELGSNREMKPSWYKIIYPFHHFDIEEEGDTCRTRFVKKLRGILDEEQFFDEFNQMWGDIKDDRVKVEDPWDP